MLLRRFWNVCSFWITPEGMTSAIVLKALLWINAAGTVYGYIWYGEQMEDTLTHHPLWRVLFVPDSPTASLFFTLALLWLLRDPGRHQAGAAAGWLRSFIEAFAVVTSFKYGIWAASIIALSITQGEPAGWQDWMLSSSHLGMAAEVLLYVRFFRIRPSALAAVGLWTFFNDFADYTYGIFPWLPLVLYDEVDAIRDFTVYLTGVSLLLTGFAAWKPGKNRV